MTESRYRVWWVPQVPMKAFYYPTPDLATARVLMDALAEYDLFQFENRIKPDYCNAGGIQEFTDDDEWEDIDPTCLHCAEDLSDARADVGLCEECAP